RRPAVVGHEEPEELGGGVELEERLALLGVVEAGLVDQEPSDDVVFQDGLGKPAAGDEPAAAAPGAVLEPPGELDEGLDVGPEVTGLLKPEAHADAPAEQRADGGGPVAGGVELGGDLSPGRGTEGDDPVDPEDPGQFPEQR